MSIYEVFCVEKYVHTYIKRLNMPVFSLPLPFFMKHLLSSAYSALFPSFLQQVGEANS